MKHAVEMLHDHQRRVLDQLVRMAACLNAPREEAMERMPPIRAALTDALRAYQLFKHETVFDPAVASGVEPRAGLGRSMKIECIAAGEMFRMHIMRCNAGATADDSWADHQAESRLTLNAMRRHVETEAEGVERLVMMTAPDRQVA